MKLIRRTVSSISVALFLLSLGVFSGCTANDPSGAANGPATDNPGATTPNSIVPAVGTVGNGGGVSGGGAGSAVGH